MKTTQQGNNEVQQRLTRARRRGQAGQSLIVAIIVLFLLLFLGGVFIALIANNYKNTGRAVNTTAATGFANAGLQYLDEQLTKSPEGADWRPVPDNLPAPGVGVTDYDPDYFWLKPYDPATGEGGYTRISFGGPTPSSGHVGGRALVRVTYRPSIFDSTKPVSATNPIPDPTSRYIKLESIGRTGTVIANDPTTYGNSQRAGLRRELVAFKSIGITDYARFITNKDNKPGTATLGAPFPTFDRPLDTTGSTNPNDYLGNPTQRSICSVYAGSIRVNAPLEFYGINQFTLNPDRNDVIEVAGPISMHNVRPNADGTNGDFDNTRNPEPANVTVTVKRAGQTDLVSRVFPSTSPSFTTGVVGYDATTNPIAIPGVIRDSPAGSETMGLTDATPSLVSAGTVPAYTPSPNLRSTPRLTPPVIDNTIGSNGLTRYRALTRNSAPLAPKYTQTNPIDPTKVSNDFAGQIGWGTGLYINNAQDVQQSSTNIFGGYSLRGDWLSPSRAAPGTNTYWKGDLMYVPPAVTITLTPRYMILTRSPYAQGRSYFRDNNGNRVNESTIIRYTSAGVAKPTAGIPSGLAPYVYEGYPADNKDLAGNTLKYYQGDYVVYAEGNIRVRGVVGGIDPETKAKFLRHLTLVSGGTIYIDGNLLRDNITPSVAAGDPDAATIKGKSSIALLAKDYVCVNTTQFLNPAATNYVQESGEFVPLARQLQPGEGFDFGFSFGPKDADNNIPDYVTDPNGPGLSLLLRHASAFIDTSALAGGSGAAINLLGIATPFTFPQPYVFTPPGTISLPVPSQTYLLERFALNNDPTANPLGFDNLFSLVNDASGGGVSAYKVTRAGIVPRDIRIEAFMYAQEGSFFIIPGPWFNPNPNDTYERYISTDPTNPTAGPAYRRPEETSGTIGQPRVDPRYPFYGQPLDVRITLYGTIAENLPAEVGDQGAWLEKWGWIPRYYGSTELPNAEGFPSQVISPATVIRSVHGYPTANPNFRTGEGIYYDFNPDAISPYLANGAPIRPNPQQPSDPLPIVPNLPVAPGLLYTGENPVQ